METYHTLPKALHHLSRPMGRRLPARQCALEAREQARPCAALRCACALLGLLQRACSCSPDDDGRAARVTRGCSLAQGGRLGRDGSERGVGGDVVVVAGAVDDVLGLARVTPSEQS